MIVRALVAAYATRHPTTPPAPRRRTRRIGVALAVPAIALGAPAAPALAAGFTLALAQQSEAVVGRPLLIQATGTEPPTAPGDLTLPYWFSLDAIPTVLTTTCPPDRWEGAQFANANGGAIIVLSQSENRDPAGNFTIPVAITPLAPGSILLCGYTDDGAAATMAGASLMLDIKPAPSSALRKAKARCRRLRSRKARVRCLRRVSRAAGRG
jgi:hypothetical protein